MTGYARNFLLPKKKAVDANNQNLSNLKSKQQSIEHKKDVGYRRHRGGA